MAEKREYREIKEEHIKEMSKLFAETFNSPPWNDMWTEDTAYKRLHRFYNTEGFYGLCAYTDDKMCAMILGGMEQYYDGTVFNIKEFAVANSQRGKGIGSALYGELEKRLEEKNVVRIVLLTIRGELTEGFYNKMGFDRSRETIVMEKEIQSCKSV